MSQSSDAWYVRLPDGRVLRANSTGAVRHHVVRGRIPLDSFVRRAPEDEWTALEWTEEFAGLFTRQTSSEAMAHAAAPVPAPAPAPQPVVPLRHDPMLLHPVGVRGLVEGLLAALDSTLTSQKLVIAAVAGVLGAVVCLGTGLVLGQLEPPLLHAVGGGAAFVLLLLFVVTDALLTQLTYVELSRLRSAQWAEGLHGLGQASARAISVYLLLALLLGGIWYALRLVASGGVGTEGMPGVQEAAQVLGALLEVSLGPVLGSALLLVPIFIVEECGPVAGLGIWFDLMRRHFLRLLLYEALVVVAGLVAIQPLLLPVVLAWLGHGLEGTLSLPLASTLQLLAGLALAPLVAFVAVANVSIYLNLRYEQPTRRS